MEITCNENLCLLCFKLYSNPRVYTVMQRFTLEVQDPHWYHRILIEITGVTSEISDWNPKNRIHIRILEYILESLWNQVSVLQTQDPHWNPKIHAGIPRWSPECRIPHCNCTTHQESNWNTNTEIPGFIQKSQYSRWSPTILSSIELQDMCSVSILRSTFQSQDTHWNTHWNINIYIRNQWSTME